jgi:uncharacterized protein YnzC (UPF0291/DUF896 family)
MKVTIKELEEYTKMRKDENITTLEHRELDRFRFVYCVIIRTTNELEEHT